MKNSKGLWPFPIPFKWNLPLYFEDFPHMMHSHTDPSLLIIAPISELSSSRLLIWTKDKTIISTSYLILRTLLLSIRKKTIKLSGWWAFIKNQTAWVQLCELSALLVFQNLLQNVHEKPGKARCLASTCFLMTVVYREVWPQTRHSQYVPVSVWDFLIIADICTSNSSTELGVTKI